MMSAHIFTHFSSVENKKLSLKPLLSKSVHEVQTSLSSVLVTCLFYELGVTLLIAAAKHSLLLSSFIFHDWPVHLNSTVWLWQILYYTEFWLCSFRLMYWTDWGRQPKIECAWMDGQQRQTLVSEDLGWPTGLSIDYLNNDRIYWSDSKENIIESMRHDGTDRTIVLHGGKNLLWNSHSSNQDVCLTSTLFIRVC